MQRKLTWKVRLPQLPQWISVAVASLWLGISCVYYLQLLHVVTGHSEVLM